MLGKGRTTNKISQGLFLSTVIQGRDIALQLPAEITPAMSALPMGNPAFAGRAPDLEILLNTLKPPKSELSADALATSTALLTAMDGLPGIGKTELAVQAARVALSRGWFPGGVLFVDLFGYDPARRLDAGKALEGFLRAMGIPGEHIPPQTQDRVRLYASVLMTYAREERRILVVVDGASSVDQARPLLPADGVNAAIVTSRDTLGLAGARLLNLDVLQPKSAIEMLDKALRIARSDDNRVKENPDDAAQIADLCGGLPLALAIIAALLAEDPERPLEALVDDLRNERTRLDELSYGDIAVRAAFDLSYQRLEPGSARLFRLLSVNPGPDISTSAAVVLGAADGATILQSFKKLADNSTPLTNRRFFVLLKSLIETDRAITRRALEALARAHLIERGSKYGRWQMHDLIRLFATENGLKRAQQDRRALVLGLLLTYYLAGTRASSAHLDHTILEPTTYGFPDDRRALEWLDTEYVNLVAAVYAADTNKTYSSIVLNLTRSLYYVINIRGRHNDAIALSPIAIRAARRLRDRHGEGVVLRNLAGAQMEVGLPEKSVATYKIALRAYRETGDRVGEGTVLANLGGALTKVGQIDEAIKNLQDALQVDREFGARYSEGVALNNLGAAFEKAGNIEQAVTAFREAVKIQREVGDQRAQAMALNNLGVMLQQVGRFDEAIKQHRIAAKIRHLIGDQQGEAQALMGGAEAFLKAQRFDDAITALRDAAHIYRDIEDRHSEDIAMSRMKAIQQASGP